MAGGRGRVEVRGRCRVRSLLEVPAVESADEDMIVVADDIVLRLGSVIGL